MTDTSTAPAAPQSISISVDMLTSKVADIKTIDSQIAAASGSVEETRKAIVAQITGAVQDKVNALLPQMIAQMKALDPATLLGILDAFPAAASTELEPITSKLVDDSVTQATASNPEVDVNSLKEKRKAEVELFRAIKTMLGSLGVKEALAIEEPKRSGGGRTGGVSSAKSGKNKENYQFTMDGKDRPPSQNTFSSLAYYVTVGLKMTGNDVATLTTEGATKDDRLSSEQFRAVLTNYGVNYGEADTWEISLPNNKKVGARRVTPVAEPAGETAAAPVEPVAATA